MHLLRPPAASVQRVARPLQRSIPPYTNRNGNTFEEARGRERSSHIVVRIMEQQSAAAGGGGCCGSLFVLLLITGGVMYGVCKDADTNGKCGGNVEIAEAGYIMMIVCGSLLAAQCLVCLLCVSCMACVVAKEESGFKNGAREMPASRFNHSLAMA